MTAAELTERAVAVLRSRAIGHLATLLPDGSPHVSPVWVDAQDGFVLVNTAAGRAKLRNVERDPRVALSIEELDGDRQALMIRGRVVEIETDGALEHIDVLSRRYDDTAWTPVAGQRRVVLKIRPDRVSWF
jgi:PPOX class probable F420-dependent enzyme